MERIPEPELMDDADQARAYADTDFSESHERVVDQFEAHLGGTVDAGTVLDLGCGPADVTLRFLRRFPDVHCVGVDASAPMLELAARAARESGLAARLELRLEYLPSTRPAHEHFAAVISNSLLHHMRDPQALWQTVELALEPGCRFVVCDLTRPANRERAAEIVETYAAGAADVLRTDFYNSLCAAYTPAEVAAQLAATQLVADVEQFTDRHLVVRGAR